MGHVGAAMAEVVEEEEEGEVVEEEEEGGDNFAWKKGIEILEIILALGIGVLSVCLIGGKSLSVV
jgi:hypothetical protein